MIRTIEDMTSMLHRLSAHQRLGHAYLAVHRDAARLRRLALETVQVLFCAAPTSEGKPCGKCGGCIAVLSDNHPEVHWLAPDGASLKIHQMRAAVKQDAHMVSFGKRHVIIIEKAHKLTPEAASAILKWVEEPHKDRLFLLLATSQSGVMSTLRSRCTILRIADYSWRPGLSDEELADQFGMAGRAERFAEMTELVLELGEALAKRDGSVWHLASARLAKWADVSEEASVLTDLLVSYLRDAAAVAYGAAPIVFSRQDRFVEAARLVDPATWIRLAVQAAGLRRRLAAHVNAVLAMESFLLRAADELGQPVSTA